MISFFIKTSITTISVKAFLMTNSKLLHIIEIMLWNLSWFSVAKNCGVLHLSAPSDSGFSFPLSLIYFIFLSLASSHSDWVIWAYESLKTAFCQDPNQLISAHQHTCHALCVWVFLALRWLLLSPPVSPPSSFFFFSLCCFLCTE